MPVVSGCAPASAESSAASTKNTKPRLADYGAPLLSGLAFPNSSTICWIFTASSRTTRQGPVLSGSERRPKSPSPLIYAMENGHSEGGAKMVARVLEEKRVRFRSARKRFVAPRPRFRRPRSHPANLALEYAVRAKRACLQRLRLPPEIRRRAPTNPPRLHPRPPNRNFECESQSFSLFCEVKVPPPTRNKTKSTCHPECIRQGPVCWTPVKPEMRDGPQASNISTCNLISPLSSK